MLPAADVSMTVLLLRYTFSARDNTGGQSRALLEGRGAVEESIVCV